MRGASFWWTILARASCRDTDTRHVALKTSHRVTAQTNPAVTRGNVLAPASPPIHAQRVPPPSSAARLGLHLLRALSSMYLCFHAYLRANEHDGTVHDRDN